MQIQNKIAFICQAYKSGRSINALNVSTWNGGKHKDTEKFIRTMRNVIYIFGFPWNTSQSREISSWSSKGTLLAKEQNQPFNFLVYTLQSVLTSRILTLVYAPLFTQVKTLRRFKMHYTSVLNQKYTFLWRVQRIENRWINEVFSSTVVVSKSWNFPFKIKFISIRSCGNS